MDIGTAIKILRKEKGLGQKQLAEMCGISVNALSQIEINSTFPQKGTIKKICESLQIPVSYLLFFSISEEDIPDDKKIVFKSLNSAIKSVLID
ncbi:helix-turn-helix domain-containing protein [Flavobacterium sp. UBA7663]|uniref:helix-turn-helix domain-containing protein n=1 Tax=Flavobacterium sp. UBA7663 TaxID=1946557 RepID=UPI0025B7BB9C|nr:helix-turn-helix transcriptional regulator [Flavobacterium sp. UBA7663]